MDLLRLIVVSLILLCVSCACRRDLKTTDGPEVLSAIPIISSEVSDMMGKTPFRHEEGWFSIPKHHWQAILECLTPASRQEIIPTDEDNAAVGKISMRLVNGRQLEITLYLSGNGSCVYSFDGKFWNHQDKSRGDMADGIVSVLDDLGSK